MSGGKIPEHEVIVLSSDDETSTHQVVSSRKRIKAVNSNTSRNSRHREKNLKSVKKDMSNTNKVSFPSPYVRRKFDQVNPSSIRTSQVTKSVQNNTVHDKTSTNSIHRERQVIKQNSKSDNSHTSSSSVTSPFGSRKRKHSDEPVADPIVPTSNSSVLRQRNEKKLMTKLDILKKCGLTIKNIKQNTKISGGSSEDCVIIKDNCSKVTLDVVKSDSIALVNHKRGNKPKDVIKQTEKNMFLSNQMTTSSSLIEKGTDFPTKSRTIVNNKLQSDKSNSKIPDIQVIDIAKKSLKNLLNGSSQKVKLDDYSVKKKIKDEKEQSISNNDSNITRVQKVPELMTRTRETLTTVGQSERPEPGIHIINIDNGKTPLKLLKDNVIDHESPCDISKLFTNSSETITKNSALPKSVQDVSIIVINVEKDANECTRSVTQKNSVVELNDDSNTIIKPLKINCEPSSVIEDSSNLKSSLDDACSSLIKLRDSKISSKEDVSILNTLLTTDDKIANISSINKPIEIDCRQSSVIKNSANAKISFKEAVDANMKTLLKLNSNSTNILCDQHVSSYRSFSKEASGIGQELSSSKKRFYVEPNGVIHRELPPSKRPKLNEESIKENGLKLNIDKHLSNDCHDVNDVCTNVNNEERLKKFLEFCEPFAVKLETGINSSEWKEIVRNLFKGFHVANPSYTLGKEFKEFLSFSKEEIKKKPSSVLIQLHAIAKEFKLYKVKKPKRLKISSPAELNKDHTPSDIKFDMLRGSIGNNLDVNQNDQCISNVMIDQCKPNTKIDPTCDAADLSTTVSRASTVKVKLKINGPIAEFKADKIRGTTSSDEKLKRSSYFEALNLHEASTSKNVSQLPFISKNESIAECSSPEIIEDNSPSIISSEQNNEFPHFKFVTESKPSNSSNLHILACNTSSSINLIEQKSKEVGDKSPSIISNEQTEQERPCFTFVAESMPCTSSNVEKDQPLSVISSLQDEQKRCGSVCATDNMQSTSSNIQISAHNLSPTLKSTEQENKNIEDQSQSIILNKQKEHEKSCFAFATICVPSTSSNVQIENEVEEDKQSPNLISNLQSEQEKPSFTFSAENMPSTSSNIPISESSNSKLIHEKNKKTEGQIERLERLLGKLDRKITKLQEKELSLDDLDDDQSAYVMGERLKEKSMKVWTVLCKLKKRSTKVGREVDRPIAYQGSRYDAVNRAVEKFVNKKKVFPDFTDICNVINQVHNDKDLGLQPYELTELARRIFQDIGALLKRRRLKDYRQLMGCSLTDTTELNDPAESDENLREKLAENASAAKKKIDELVEEFALKQMRLKNGQDEEDSSASDNEDTDKNYNENDGDPPENDEDPPENDTVASDVEVNISDQIDDLPETDAVASSSDEEEKPNLVSTSVLPLRDLAASYKKNTGRNVDSFENDVIDIVSNSDVDTEPNENAKSHDHVEILSSEFDVDNAPMSYGDKCLKFVSQFSVAGDKPDIEILNNYS